MSPAKRTTLVCLLAVFVAVALLASACGSKDTIVARWQFDRTQGGWGYEWMEFFEDGTYTDNWGNSRTWTLLSDGRLKLTARLDGYVFLFEVNIRGDTMEIVAEDGDSATGTRVQK